MKEILSKAWADIKWQAKAFIAGVGAILYAALPQLFEEGAETFTKWLVSVLTVVLVRQVPNADRPS